MTNDRKPTGFLPHDFKGPDVHDEISADTLSWQPAEVIDLGEFSAEVHEVTSYWTMRHRVIDLCEEVLIGLGCLDVGAHWLRAQGWRFQDMTTTDLPLFRRFGLDQLDPDSHKVWAAKRRKASEADVVILRDWRQELRKAALWLLAGDAHDALKVAAYVRDEYGEYAPVALTDACDELFVRMRKVVPSAKDDAHWLIESYVLFSAMADVDGLLRRAEPNKIHPVVQLQMIQEDA